MKMNEFKLNESLFTEAENIDVNTGEEEYEAQIPEDTFDDIFGGTDIDKANKDFIQMIKSPYKKFGLDPISGQNKPHVLKQQAYILLKLYELTIWNVNNPYVHRGMAYTDPFTGELFDPGYGVKRNDLLKIAGVANPDEPGEGSTFFGDFKHIGLAYINPAGVKSDEGYVFPGSRLEPYVQGCLDESYGAKTFNRKTKQMDPFTNFEPMTGDIGGPGRPRKTPSASKTRNPGTMDNPFADILPSSEVVPQEKKSKEEDPHDWFKDNEPKANPVEPEVKPEVKPVEPEKPEEFKKFNTNRFRKKNEDLNEDLLPNEMVGPTTLELTGDAFLINDMAEFIVKVMNAYREWRGLEPGADISDDYNAYDFNAVCACNQWPVDIKKNIWKDRDFS